MQPDGLNALSPVLAVWREAGEWWSGDPSREIHRCIDAKGIRREVEIELPSLGSMGSGQEAYREDNRIEVFARSKKNKPELAFVARTEIAPYVPLHVQSGYAFGRGTMLADEIPMMAASYGISSCALTDPMSLVGAVEFVRSCKKHGVKPIVGATIELPEGGELVLLARSKRGFQNLSLLISACHLDEPRQFPLGSWERIERYSADLICLTGGDSGPLNRHVIRRDFARSESVLRRLTSIYGNSNVFVEIERSFLPWQIATNRRLIELAETCEVDCVAGGVATHARREDFPVRDILSCIHTLCTVDEVLGRKLPREPSQIQCPRLPERDLNGERFLKTPAEMAELYSDSPWLLENTRLVADRCDSEVLPDRTRLPQLYENDYEALREITMIGAFRRHGQISKGLKKRIRYELDRIVRLGFAGHFLTAYDMVKWADDQQIQFSGRGSVVDSAVAYCLGFSRIDAYKHNLHFDRFLPEDGTKRPDIDIDFEARRRDDIREYLTCKYGRDHVATVAAVGAYCTRGIVREVGKALGLPNETIGFLAKRIHGGVPAHQLESALELRPELKGSGIPKERFKWVFQLAEKMMDLPRNMRAHSSGVVISSRPISETVPVMWSASETPVSPLRILQWDKRSAKYFFDKFDVLCLRGQDVLSGTESRVRVNTKDFSVTRITTDDPETYRAMRSGELVGIPQSASPAMRQAHMRLKTENLHDASLVQAGIRPGVGGAVKLNQLIARRLGKETYSFEHPELERILGHTYGIIVFQEQADQLLQTFCGFTSGQAEDLRDTITKRRREEFTQQIQSELTGRIIERGFSRIVAEKVVEYVVGFKGFGFAEGHALAFAEISIRSIYCQQNHPSEYFAALLSAQPAGYYGPCTIVNEARSRGVAILPPDVNASEEEFGVEDVLRDGLIVPGGGIRIALKQIANLSERTRTRIASYPMLQGDPAFEELPLPTIARQSEGRVLLLQAQEAGSVASSFSPPRTCSRRSLAGDSSRSRGFRSIFDFTAKVQPDRPELEQLIFCGAFDSLHENRRALLWSIPAAIDFGKSMDPDVLPLEMPEPELPTGLEDFTLAERAIHERRVLGLDIDRHLMAFERERVASRGGVTTEIARRLPSGRKAIVVGNPIRLRFPPTASGKRVVFFDLEDETGLLNVTCFDEVYQRDGHAIVCSPYVTLIGEAQDRDGHTAFLAHRVFAYEPVILKQCATKSLPIASGDFLVG